MRRFTCPNASCQRRTLVEQVPGLTRCHSQRTERLRSTLSDSGLALAGRAGARMSLVLGASVSRSTVLRLVEALAEPDPPAPRVVGVDEYATRKGRHDGTVLVDVETRRPVDLLPDREAARLAAWLAERPGIEVACRDRAPFFAEGAAADAPQAVQVAAGGTCGTTWAKPPTRPSPSTAAAFEPSSPPSPSQNRPPDSADEEPSGSPWPSGHRFADRTRARHAAVHTLLEAGHSHRSIQRQLGMTWRTVEQLADAAAPEELFTGQWQNQPSVLDDYEHYLDERWTDGCTNAWKLWEEIVPLGCKGSYQRVRACLHKKRTSPRPVTARPPSPRTVTRWIRSRPETLTEPEQLQLKTVRAHCPELDALTRHVRAFATMLTQREGERLPTWLDAVRQDDLPSLHTLAAGIDPELDAVRAGLTLPWNSGLVEGHVNRIKMLKRQMFGRAGFQLLRRRVLLA